MLKDAKAGRITDLRPARDAPGGARLREAFDAFINVQVNALAEPQPRKEELHMDKVKPASLLRRFKALVKICPGWALYSNVDGVDTYHFDDSYFRKRWQRRLKFGHPR